MLFDCFTFFDELELLELRLRELDAVADKFVLVESTKTHAGHPKALHFAENRERFGDWADRIVHIVVDDMPGGDGPRDHWVRERHQRNAIGRGLAGCRPQDVVMVSDLDEIPNPQTVTRFIAELEFKDDFVSDAVHRALNSRLTRFLFHRKTLRHLLRKNHPFIWKLEQHPCFYYLNLKPSGHKWWSGTTIMHYRDFSIADEMRYSGYKVVKDGGWHFSYMGGSSRIKTKVAAMAHQEINNPEWIERALKDSDREQVVRDLAKGVLELLPFAKMPATIRADPDRYSAWLIDPADPHRQQA